MAKINQEEALRMYQGGATDVEVANRFGASRQGAKWFRDQFLKDGSLSSYKGRGRKATTGTKPVQVRAREDGQGAPTVSLLERLVEASELVSEHKDISDFLLGNDAVRRELADQIGAAKEVPELRRELRKYRSGYNNMKDHATGLEKKIQDMMKGKLAVQQGDVTPPLKRGGGGYFTYHILAQPLLFLLTHNINFLSNIILLNAFVHCDNVLLRKEVTLCNR